MSSQQPAGAPGAEPPRIPFESMSITVSEDRSSYTVRGRMPGVRREDVEIDISDDRTLRIRAVRRASSRGGVLGAGGGGAASMMMVDQGTGVGGMMMGQQAERQQEEDPVICNIGRNYILPKYADPDNMRADLQPTGELTVVIYKGTDHIDKKKARIS